jgi:Ca2+-binding EF-hand superfamily protein
LDADKSGTLDYNDLKGVYNAQKHPEVRAGTKTEQEVIQDFLETFEVHRTLSKGDKLSRKDGSVTMNEFLDYYSNVSASIDDDEYFKLMITNAWNLDNKGSYKKAYKAEY